MICHLQVEGPGKQVVVFQSKPKGLRTREDKCVSPGSSPKTSEPEVPVAEGNRKWMSSSSKQQIHPFSAFLFHAGLQGIGQCPLTLVTVDLLYSVSQFKC